MMTTKEKKKLFKDLLKKFGDLQMVVAVEELSELQKEICKAMRNRLDKEHLTEEIADAEIVIKQVKMYYNIIDEQVDKVKEEKLERTRERLF